MKKIILTLWALATVSMLTACPDKGGSKNDNFLTSPNSCLHYYQDPATGYYYDSAGRQVNCNQGYFGQGYNNYYMPYQQYYNGGYQSGCSSWSNYYPGNVYIPIQMQGYGYVCMNISQLNSYIPNYSTMYNYYGYYPSYSCQWGVNCGSSCVGGGAGVNFGPLWLGGTLGLCWY
jgi:hypothetical protein